jgi:uncharacterized protein YjbI with pentapeptide repeats
MDPTVVAAWIAAGVSVLTLAGTLTAQYLGYRATSRDAEKTAGEQRKAAEEQREQLDRTFAEQNQQLDRTLAEQRTRTLNERFATAAEQLGSDRPAVRLAGVYAMAGLADDWAENRQTCVDVLCAYLRMPYEPDPGEDVPEPQRQAFRAFREVRHTVIRVITAHLKEGAGVSWQGLDLDFTGVVFDGGDFSDARFSGGDVCFRSAQFSGGLVDFGSAQFSGGRADFRSAQFSGGKIDFSKAWFPGGAVWFSSAQFSGGTVHFNQARFSGSELTFVDAQFSGGRVNFWDAVFSDGRVNFWGSVFSGGLVDFRSARFSGGTIHFVGARFSGGKADFNGARDWSVPPIFPWTDKPPPGVKLPGGSGTALPPVVS